MSDIQYTSRLLTPPTIRHLAKEFNCTVKAGEDIYWFFTNNGYCPLFLSKPGEGGQPVLLTANTTSISEVELFQELRTAVPLDEWIENNG